MAQPLSRAGAALLLAATLAACGGRGPAPSADAPPPPAPDLSGIVVMLLPAQASAYTRLPAGDGSSTGGAELDAELAYWLQERGAHVRWVLPDRLREVLARSPGLGIDIANLDVSVFRRAQVERIGDPLFGDLVRLAAIADARLALIPTFVTYRPGAGGEPGRLELAATLVDCQDGRVHWFGVVAGEPGPTVARVTVASAAQALARALFR